MFYCSGILAGIWPCGVITLIRELFTAESKGQVYGHLHQFLQSHSHTASNLRKFLFIRLYLLYIVHGYFSLYE